MTVAELLDVLVKATLALTAALIVVLALRRPLRTVAGAVIAYRLWILVPAALVAVLLPAATVTLPAPASLPVAATMAEAVSMTAADAPDYRVWAAALWLAGVLMAALALWRQQHRFARRLGVTAPSGKGVVRAVHATAGLPAAMGLLRPRIVLPADFETRYTPEQQALMRLHEQVHIRSGDLQLNGLLALLRCVFWFHPLLHYAARHFRHDQELACDQHVIARHPQARRAYGEAMFKIQLAAQPLPLGCHWGYSHPLKERIEMLKQPLPSLSRWVGGSLVVAGLAAATAFTAWAAQPPRAIPAVSATSDAVSVSVVARIGGGAQRTSAFAVEPGRPHSLAFEQDGQQWNMELTITTLADGRFDIGSTLTRDGTVVGQPRLVVRSGEVAAIGVGEEIPGGAFDGIQLEIVARGASPTAMTSTPARDDTPTEALRRDRGAPGAAAAILIQPPMYRRLAPPTYPPGDSLQGRVLLDVTVSANGAVEQVEVARSSGFSALDASARDAVRGWLFEPARQGGAPVAARVQVPVDFLPAGARVPAEAPTSGATMLEAIAVRRP